MFDPCLQTYSLLLGCHTNTWLRFTYSYLWYKVKQKLRTPRLIARAKTSQWLEHERVGLCRQLPQASTEDFFYSIQFREGWKSEGWTLLQFTAHMTRIWMSKLKVEKLFMPGKFRKTFVIILHKKKDLRGSVRGVHPDSKPNRRLMLWKNSVTGSQQYPTNGSRQKEWKNTEAPWCRSLQMRKNLCVFYI